MQVVENINKRTWNKSIRWYLLLAALFFFSYAQAQLTANNTSLLPIPTLKLKHFDALHANTSQIISLDFKGNSPIKTSNHTSPVVYSYHHLGIMCKLDVQLEKSMKLPVKFRLGTQEYVDRLEGKY